MPAILKTGQKRHMPAAFTGWRRVNSSMRHRSSCSAAYARYDWIDEPANGYQSALDILIVVGHKDLTDIAEYWYVSEDKIQRDTAIARPVNLTVHALDEVNSGLTRGEYFWVDIARDGIAFYQLAGSALVTPRPLTAADAYEMAGADLTDWLTKINEALDIAEFCVSMFVPRAPGQGQGHRAALRPSDAVLKECGYLAMGGQIIDATVGRVPSSATY